MESKNLLTLVVTLTVGIILAGSLLMPVISDAIEDNQTTVYNNTGYKWHMVEADEAVTASYDGTTCLVNGNAISFGPTYSFIIADTFYCRWTSNTVFSAVYDYENETGIYYNTWSLEAENGTCTITNLADTTKSETVEYSWLFIPGETYSTPSDWIMTNGNSTYYVTDESEIYCASSDGNIVIQGKFKDLQVTTNGEPADFVIDATPVTGYDENVYKLAKLTVTGFNGTDYTYNRIVVPSEIVLTNEGTSPYIALYSAIPVMMILGLVVAALGAIYTKRDD